MSKIEELGVNGLKLKQDNNALKLGTDAVLLYDFVRVTKNAKIVDIGAGGGAISVLLAGKYSNITISALEIQEAAYSLLCDNIALNSLEKIITPVNGDMCKVQELYTKASFDLVVSNPPYMAKNAGLKTENEAIKISKYEEKMTLDDVCRAAAYLLRFGGNFSIVYRPDRLAELFLTLQKYQFAPKRLRFVQNDSKTPPSIILLESRLGGGVGLSVLPTHILKNLDGSETEETKAIYER